MHAMRQTRPDAVLLDWMMPGQDGIAVLGALRSDPATRPVPILMMTARTDEVDRVDVYKRQGMVFQKPNPFPMSVYDNIAYGPRVHGIKAKKKLDELVERSLRAVSYTHLDVYKRQAQSTHCHNFSSLSPIWRLLPLPKHLHKV